MKDNSLQLQNISMSTISIFDQKVWFLEYSTTQKCFHVDDLENILLTNRDTSRRGICLGYVIIDGPMLYKDLFNSMKKWCRELALETTTLEGNVCKATPKGTFKLVKVRRNKRNMRK